MKVAIIEDDMDQARLIAYWLKPYGFESTLFINAEIFLESPFNLSFFDLILVDWMLPGINGLNLVQTICQHSGHPPIIFVTDKYKVDELASALHSGADDFISKPLNKTILLARITATLRRFGHSIETQQTVLRVNSDKRLLEFNDQTCSLTEDELKIMSLFLSSADTLISREQLTELVLKCSKSSDTGRVVDLKISRLRKKLNKFTPPAGEINSQYGKGYIFKITSHQ